MDNKITKRRLSDFLAYEWILMIVIAVVAILVWELVYTMAGVRLSVGQQFKFYFDETVYGNASAVISILDKDGEDGALSYDILELNAESLSSDFNVLSTRLSIQEGDILITDCKDPTEEENSEEVEDKSIRLKTMVDSYDGYAFEELLLDAKIYLLGFIKDNVSDPFDYSVLEKKETLVANLDTQKIEKSFRSRMKKDNRFRKESDIKIGIGLETERLTKLYKEVVAFDNLLEFENQYNNLFYRYTKYSQSRDKQEKESDKNAWNDYTQNEIKRLTDRGITGTEKVNGEFTDTEFIYAINLVALPTVEVKTNPSDLCVYKGTESAENVCIMVFDFRSYQPHLQFETISFINAIVRSCSTLNIG